jgi:hypothetical protein
MRVRPLSPWVFGLAGAVFAAHLAVVAWGPYGPHRDALLYYAMGENLRLFAMDFPPFIALVARLFTVFGNVEWLTHVPVAAAHGALIVLAAAFAGRAGGGAGAQGIAAVSVASAPVFLRAGSLFQPVVFDQLWWTAALWALASVGTGPGEGRQTAQVDSAPPGRWLALGAFLGLGLLTKFTVLVLAAGVFVAILATPLRRALATPWPWAAAGVALLVGSPSLVGQAVLGWPFFGQLEDLAGAQLVHVSPVSFAVEQLFLVGPIVIVAGVATVVLAVREPDVGLRAVAWAAVASFGIVLLAGGKPYYIAPIWPALLGIGVGRLDARLGSRASDGAAGSPVPRRRAVSGVLHGGLWVLALGWGLLTLPLGLPFLAPEPMAAYAARLGDGPVTTNTGEVIDLPQDYADMLGWDDLAREVETVWRGLPSEERGRAVILATNYGRAGAIDWFGSDDLPPARAPVGSYWFWGPGDLPGDVVIFVGGEAAELEGPWFRSAREVVRVRRPWGVPEEREIPIVVARDPVRTLHEVWPEFAGRN